MRDTPNYLKLTDANFQKEVLESYATRSRGFFGRTGVDPAI